ncbi:hypothetical protein CDAR_429881 [Caerostris darwini]|uniref:Uncharacterized protein n=1 Tax=Caerostris darwini TaxID=1538125 RepID=A0AAV4TVR7_9ARAC|nr:hypothetical protein CDAR_429881 [Caerostris darwini]
MDNASDVCELQRSQSLPAIHFRPFNNGRLWPTPEEERCSNETPGKESCFYVTPGDGSCSYVTAGEESCSCEAAREESVIDSPAQKKRWWC